MRGSKLILPAAAAAAFYSTTLFAGQVQGEGAQQEPKSQNSVPLDLQSLRAQAQRGDIRALHDLATLYATGKLGEVNRPEAFRLFDEAAKKGSNKSAFAAAMIKFIGGQHQSIAPDEKRNFDLENCPDKSAGNKYIEKFSISQSLFERLTEWPIQLEYFVIEDERPKFAKEADALSKKADTLRGAEFWQVVEQAKALRAKSKKKIDIRATFESKSNFEKPIATCYLNYISHEYHSETSKAWDGSRNKAHTFMIEYINEQMMQFGKHDQLFTRFDGEYEQRWKKIEKYYDSTAQKPYQARTICLNNFTNQFFDVTTGDVELVDERGNSLGVESIDGTRSATVIFVPQDKAGRSFLLGQNVDFVKQSLENFIWSRLNDKIYFSGSDDISGGYEQYDSFKFRKSDRHFLLIFRKRELGFHCTYKKAEVPNLEF